MPSPGTSLLKSIGPAIIIAAVVCGPGSILTASKVGAKFGYSALWILLVAVALMIGMVALAGRLGAVLEKTPCQEIAARLGRPVAIAVGVILFLVIACFQASNNFALPAGIDPLLGQPIESKGAKIAILAIVNGLIILALYRARSLYGIVEKLMKGFVLLMVLAFLFNLFAAKPSIAAAAQGLIPSIPTAEGSWIVLLGLFGTTFSVAGAFYQAYLVRERGLGVTQVREGLVDSVVGACALGGITAVVMMTAAAAFFGNEVELSSVGDVATQLEPLFGSSAKFIFGVGILAGALSSFLVNAMIGGAILADGLGLADEGIGSRWSRHLTVLALVFGLVAGIISINSGAKPMNLIVFAQALTVLGVPALCAALLYLALGTKLTGDRKIAPWIIVLGFIGFAATLVMAGKTVMALLAK